MIAVVAFFISACLFGGAVLVGKRHKNSPVGWNRVCAEYDGCTVMHDGDCTFTRHRFWFTDASGARRCVGADLQDEIYFALGRKMMIAVSPDGAKAKFIDKATSQRFRMRLLIGGVLCLIFSIYEATS